MGLGEYLSGQAEIDYFYQEREREVWELEHFAEGEYDEMVDLYKEKGFEEEDAKKLVAIMSKHKEFFVDTMMVEVSE